MKADLSGLEWRKASRSAADGACVEVAHMDAAIVVRDSQERTGPILSFGVTSWHVFLRRLKDGNPSEA